MDFTSNLIEELIDLRRQARVDKDWKLSDDIRNYLDAKLIFIFDTKAGQDIHYLTPNYFQHQTKTENNIKVKSFSEWLQNTTRIIMTERQYVELQIKSEINANNNFDAWLFSTLKSIGTKL